jgi:high affinity Mn2+ porin
MLVPPFSSQPHALKSCLRLLGWILGALTLTHAHAQRVGSDTDTPVWVPSVQRDVAGMDSNFLSSIPDAPWWSAKGQVTVVNQTNGGFGAKYSGDNSLTNTRSTKQTFDTTLYLGLRLWNGAEFYLNPEIDQGFGLSNTVGAAGFPSGEAYKVGAQNPYYRLPRVFLRQTIDLGGESFHMDDQANQMEKTITANNLTLTLGKFSVVDVFDTNTYAHDPRSDFFNWTVVEAGAFDYAADSWGFTQGAALEWTQDWWTIRGGYFALSTQPNNEKIDTQFDQHEWVAEFEERHQIAERPGKFKFLSFVNKGYMGLYADGVKYAALGGGAPDTSKVRKMNQRSGWSLNFEQEMSDDLGLFVRYSQNDGAKEAFDFTEVNQSLSSGLLLKGSAWKRHNDSLGLAWVSNRLSQDAQSYFKAGGMGILIGDGGLSYANEMITEVFYNLVFNDSLSMALDYQNIKNPAYNQDRGPVNILGVRLHASF